MRKPLQYLLLSMLPVIFFLSGNLLKNAQGPYYINFYDPSYVYLINSLNIEQGAGVGHFDHPGTTVQIIGAVCIKIYNAFNGADTGIIKDVLTRPESYLLFINRMMQLLNSVVLLLLGLFTLRISSNLFIALAIQLTPFISPEIFYGMITVTPENILIGVMLLLTGSVLYYIYKIEVTEAMPMRFVIITALICGAGLATKISFFPVIIIPFFLINNFKQKLIFLPVVIISFFIMIIPGISNFSYFLNWVKKLILFDGRYGTGNAAIINLSGFIDNLIKIFQNDIFFSLTYFAIVMVCVLYLRNRSKNEKSVFAEKCFRALVLIFSAMSIQVIIVAKQYAQYYMLPAFMLCVPALILCSILIPETVHKKYIAVRTETVLWIVVVLISVFSAIEILRAYQKANEERLEGVKIEDYINENHAGEFIVPQFMTVSKDCALAFSAGYAGPQAKEYFSLLNEALKNKLFFDPWSGKFYVNVNGEPVKNIFKGKNKFLLQKAFFASPDDFIASLDQALGVTGSSYKMLFENKYTEGIYEITIGNDFE